jgi:hypothetical protein
MNKIKSFVEKFAGSEARVSTLARTRDLAAYNNELKIYYSFLVKQLQGATGYMPKETPLSDIEYEMFKGYPETKPRGIFKISEYKSQKYGTVWVAFVSEQNFDEYYKSLQDALFVIEESGELKIAKNMLYTNYSENGDQNTPYRWDDMKGYQDLNFETIGEPILIERYMEPGDWLPGLELYNANI